MQLNRASRIPLVNVLKQAVIANVDVFGNAVSIITVAMQRAGGLFNDMILILACSRHLSSSWPKLAGVVGCVLSQRGNFGLYVALPGSLTCALLKAESSSLISMSHI
jgi:hypothetical protein